MNKSRKNIIISSFILTIAVVAAILLSNSWEDKLKRSSTEATEKLEKEGITIRTVDTSLLDNQEEDQQKEVDSDQETDSSQQDKNEKETDEDTNKDTSKEAPNKTTEEKPSQDQSNDQPKPTEQPSLEDIKQTYVSQFTQLETEISGRLNAILDEAINAYGEQKNREDFDLRGFQLIYATKVRQLEADSDARFREIFLQLEADLKENDYAISEAAPYQTQYIDEKQKREKRVIERLTSLQE